MLKYKRHKGKHDLESVTTLSVDKTQEDLNVLDFLFNTVLEKTPNTTVILILLKSTNYSCLYNIFTHIFRMVTKDMIFSIMNFMYNNFKLIIFST